MFDKIPSLKKDIIISTLRHILLIFPNLLNPAMGTFNLRTVFTCSAKDVQRFGKQQYFPLPADLRVYKPPSGFVHSNCVYEILCLRKYLLALGIMYECILNYISTQLLHACSCVPMCAHVDWCMCLLGREVKQCGVIIVAFN